MKDSDEIVTPSDSSEVSLDQIDPTSNSEKTDYQQNLKSINTSVLLSSWLRNRETVTFFTVIVNNKRNELINESIRLAGSQQPNNNWINKNLNQVEILDGLRDLVLEYIASQTNQE